MKGFVLYPTYRIIDGKSYVWLFGKLENNESFLTISKYEPYFYIKTKDSKRVKDLVIENTDFKNFKDEKLSRIKLELPKEVPGIRHELEDNNIVCYEADVRFSNRYLIDKGVMMGIDIDGECEMGEFVDRIYHEPSISPNNDYMPSNLKIFSVDIETSRDAKELYSIAIYSEKFNKVLIDMEEDDMLEEFKKIITEEDPDIITGWNFIDFDLQILKKKFKQHKIQFSLGRVNQTCRLKLESNFFRESKADFPGRVVLDGISLLRMSFVKLNSFKLSDVAFQILKEKKLIGEDNKVEEIERLFKEDKKKLAEYNLNDAKLVYDILKKVKAIEMNIERSMLTGLPLDRVNASIASLDSLYLRELKKRGYVANSGSYREKEERIKGGYVMDSKPGIYDNVIILDFKSVDYSEPIYLRDSSDNVKIIPIGKFVDYCLLNRESKHFKNLEIGSVPKGWKVLCFDENYKVRYSKIVQVSKHHNDDNLYEITTTSGRKIRITKSHSLFGVDKNFRPIPVEGFRLKKDDTIVVPLKVETLAREKIEHLNILSLLKNLPKEKLKDLELCIESKYCLYKYRRRIKYLKIIHDKEEITTKELERFLGLKRLCAYPVLRNLKKEKLIHIDKGRLKLTPIGLSYYKNLSLICESHKYNPNTGLCSINLLKSIKNINFENEYFKKWKWGYKKTPSNSRIGLIFPLKPLCSLLGYFAAEGCCVKSKKKDRINQDHYKVNITARDLHKKIVNDCKELGLKGYNKKEGFVTFSSRLIYFLFKDVFDTGVNAYTKKVPFFIFNQENKFKRRFLKSYFEGDGHLYSHAQQFATASEELINGISLLNMNLGNLGFKIGKYGSYFYGFINNNMFSNKKLKRVNYAFRIPNKNIPEGFFEENKREMYNKSINTKKLRSWLNSQNTKKHIFNGGLGLDTIQEIKKVKPTSKFVYDIGVNPTQNFICGRGGIVAHNSLYPSMMQTFNIDPLNYVEDCKEVKDVITAPNGACFRNNEGIMGNIVSRLLIARDKAKKEKNELQRWAIKILLNSFFGVLANPNCRFFNLNIANAITHFGQSLIKLTAKKIKEEGYEVIYGDTDACFVLSNEKNSKEAEKIGEILAKKLNSFFKEFVKKEYNRESKLILEYEKCFTRFLMPKIRGSEEGAKKRYAGLNSKGKIEITGMEFVRSDWTELAKKFQLELLKKVFEKKEVKNYVKKFVDEIKNGKYDGLLIYRKSVRKNLELYLKTTPPHVKAARKLKNFQGNVIEYLITEDGPEPVQALKNKIDYKHYIDKQIKPIADSVLLFFNVNFDELLEGSKQVDLSSF